MVLFDNHNHSDFSFDGKRTSVEKSVRAAVEAGLGGMAFTDHCDFFVPAMKAEFEDLVPETFDVKAQQAEIDRVQRMLESEEHRQFRILKGIELGMHEDCHGQIRGILSEHSFDQIIASVHYLDGTDPFYGGYYEDKEWKEAYGHYLETIWKEMTWLKDFDIMGHFDYVVRYAPYDRTSLMYRDFSDILDEMFRFLIQEGKALEINTKSYRNYKGRDITLDRNILDRYKELGGEIISLGSDSHIPEQPGTSFKEYALLLKSLGFRWSAHYESRRLVQLPL
jgi:histidinol-phosphatase (PHP family)